MQRPLGRGGGHSCIGDGSTRRAPRRVSGHSSIPHREDAPFHAHATDFVRHPATMTHAALPPGERDRIGLTDGPVRVSMGIEDVTDLEADGVRGLRAAARV